MRALVGLVRPFRIVLWVVALGYTSWWLLQALGAVLDAVLGAPSNLLEIVFIWGLFPAFAVFFLDRALAELDPYTARARRRRNQQERNLQMLVQAMTETDFLEKYRPVQRPDGGYLTWGEVKHLPANQVWTVVVCGDWDDQKMYALPGFQTFDRLGYLVSETPWTNEEEEAVWGELAAAPNPWLVGLAHAPDEDLLTIIGEFVDLPLEQWQALFADPEQLTPEHLRLLGISVDLVEIGA